MGLDTRNYIQGKKYVMWAYNSTIQVLWTAVSPNISSSSRSSVANTTKSIQFPPLSLPSGLLCSGCAVPTTVAREGRGEGMVSAVFRLSLYWSSLTLCVNLVIENAWLTTEGRLFLKIFISIFLVKTLGVCLLVPLQKIRLL